MKGIMKYFVVVMVLTASVAWATDVTFQVNMGFQITLGNFVPGTNIVVVRGSFNGWSGDANVLTDADGDSIYTGTWAIEPGTIQYKFVISPDGWEADPNREATVGTDPLVIPVDWFNRQAPVVPADVEVTFRVNMNIQILNGNFDPETDWVVVRGSHANIGNWGGETQLLEETGNPGVYSLQVQFDNLPTGIAVEYKFVYLAGGTGGEAFWENQIPSNRSFTPTGQEPDNLPPPSGNGYGEILPEVVYFNNISPDDIITNPLNVVFSVDARPLYGRLQDEGFIVDVQTGDTIHVVESLQAAGPFNNWPWGNFGTDYYMNDNGTDGDMTAGDTVWSVTLLFAAGSSRHLIYKYGANQLDVEAGFARNHEVDLDDSQPTMIIPTDCWGSPDTLYDDWDCVYAGADDPVALNPLNYQLSQNYPNPFNPTTAINFVLPRSEMTKLAVFDVLGRQVATLLDGRMEAGQHAVTFDASTLSSGVYFYRLEAGSFQMTRKMLLLK